MTYDQAVMIIMNPDCYDESEIRAAAVKILSTIDAKQEHIDAAAYCV